MQRKTWKPRIKTQVELPHVESEFEAGFDGACWPNPNGHAACGAWLKQNGVTKWVYSEYLGNSQTSNNVAEYAGLIAILRYLVENNIQSCVIYGDSNLVIKQMNREWSAGKLTKQERRGTVPIRARYYLPYYNQAMTLKEKLGSLTFRWWPREKNTEADELSTKPLRERGIREVYTKWEAAGVS